MRHSEQIVNPQSGNYGLRLKWNAFYDPFLYSARLKTIKCIEVRNRVIKNFIKPERNHTFKLKGR